MIITSQLTALRVQRFFPKMTRLSINIRSAFNLFIAKDQGEAQNAANGLLDGLQLNQANTSPPYDFWWKGELWHVASVANSQWSLIIIGEADDVSQSSSQSKLDYSPKGAMRI